MKKLTSFVLTLVMIFSLSTGIYAKSSQKAQDELPEFKIAVAFYQLDAQAVLVQKYLSEYVGPAFNVQFMFSEAVPNVETLINFMENAYAAGCDALINYQNSSIDQALAKANELGIYIVSNTSINASNADLPYNLGFVAASVQDCANSFGSLVRDLLDDGENHNVIIVSAGAGLGNLEHYESTVAILKTLQDIYGLEYDKDVADIASVRAETDVKIKNNKEMKITIYPGFPGSDTYVPGMSALLQTGEYDTVLACNAAYAQFSVAIDEVEKAYGKNIRVCAITNVTNQTKTNFNTIDSTGDNSLNSAMLMPSVSTVAGMFALAYNGISGYAEEIRVDGEGIMYNCPKWMCKDAEEYARIDQLNTSEDTYEVNIDELKQMILSFNPDATSDSIYEFLENISADSVLTVRDIK